MTQASFHVMRAACCVLRAWCFAFTPTVSDPAALISPRQRHPTEVYGSAHNVKGKAVFTCLFPLRLSCNLHASTSTSTSSSSVPLLSTREIWHIKCLYQRLPSHNLPSHEWWCCVHAVTGNKVGFILRRSCADEATQEQAIYIYIYMEMCLVHPPPQFGI